ncbi:hypothetical protein EG346_17135 [Chryseobacterium carnipullorum]|uniref:Lipoprotein n=2 Tax=Chryseobacterium carnipullorum TaxID=1124835 RepID=A0A1M7EZC9_CHRCU|nr:hypothetical protein EG346_17135 [Chryseobacterium carnipullorum]AZA64688.1 hypothetical protein EG345_08155 [Chryseobacterium carnipullorum]SHL97165.1 hypothetical protein SAMN05444360_106179 [Chryseobacterium carnipullorum]STC95767.1 Uncharacterised protein [Chryseobacterium carnipullorum]HBV17454.1 hypothetical protein [Chryseobacterium carnipullorum]
MKKIFLSLALVFGAANCAMAVPTFYYNFGSYDVEGLFVYYSSPTNGMGCYDGNILPLKLTSSNVLTNMYTGVVVPANQLTHAYVCGASPTPVCSTTTDVIFRGMRFYTTVSNFAGMAGTSCTNFTQVPTPNGWKITMPGLQSLTFIDMGFMTQYIYQ